MSKPGEQMLQLSADCTDMMLLPSLPLSSENHSDRHMNLCNNLANVY